MRQAERAIFDLRRGIPVLLRDAAGDTLIAPVEGFGLAALNEACTLAGAHPALVLSDHRLASLGVQITGISATQHFAATDVPTFAMLVQFALGRASTLPRLPVLAPAPSTDPERAGLMLMRRAQLVPAAIAFAVVPAQRDAIERLVTDGTLLAVSTEEAIGLCESGPGRLRRVSDARVPLAGLGDTSFVLFREEDGIREHVAVVLGERANWAAAVPVRVHSTCLTGDIFGSQRCDCGAQLRNGLAEINRLGGGVLLYLAQEGRGIGLANKLRAYRLQDEGLDTIDADQVIGYSKDERDYRVAHQMLDELGVTRIELLTNNPAKVTALRSAGIDVVSRRALFGQINDHNQHYLRTKADRHGHLLEELLALPHGLDRQGATECEPCTAGGGR
ncbi:GTP cyclohydrolase II [Azoarcus sp. L1K30]|uniref:GTP cyclohydrolase II n=1 Tax=Azoarcus sp. L1K30 TaxID=2820277 RepID=UPI001B81BB8C|nr:GTP cyclohydrolase II [Azoarcus sp. L1K30]MBR0565914.1 GTP cyclohydrolase II [Azoarcus sp. L1K30]